MDKLILSCCNKILSRIGVATTMFILLKLFLVVVFVNRYDFNLLIFCERMCKICVDCFVSFLVGASKSVRASFFSCVSSFMIIGNRNVRVLLFFVGVMVSNLFFEYKIGIVWCWIGVGFLKFVSRMRSSRRRSYLYFSCSFLNFCNGVGYVLFVFCMCIFRCFCIVFVLLFVSGVYDVETSRASRLAFEFDSFEFEFDLLLLLFEFVCVVCEFLFLLCFVFLLCFFVKFCVIVVFMGLKFFWLNFVLLYSLVNVCVCFVLFDVFMVCVVVWWLKMCDFDLFECCCGGGEMLFWWFVVWCGWCGVCLVCC